MTRISIAGAGIAGIATENRRASRSRPGGGGVKAVTVDGAAATGDGVTIRRGSTGDGKLGGLSKADGAVIHGEFHRAH